MAKSIDYSKHIYEGWRVLDFINELDPVFQMIISNRSHIKPFKTKAELKEWCKDNQPYYKKHIPEVVEHFNQTLKLK